MERRKLFLRIMLWSLGFAAVTGAGAILLQGGDLAWRVVGTGLVTALASGLMIPFFGMIDRKNTRPAGLLGMSVVTAEFIVVLLLIWEVIRNLLSRNVEERVGLTMVFLGLTVLLAIGFLMMLHIRQTLWTGRIGLALCIAVFLVLMLGTWEPGRWPRFNEDWWETTGALSVYGLLGVLCLVNVGTSNRRRWRWLGVAAAAAACAMCLWEIWIGPGTDLGFVVFVSLTCASAAVGHASLSILCPLTSGQRWVLWGTIGSVILMAGLVDLQVIDDRLLHMGWERGEMLSRCVGAAGILAGCGTLALVVLARLNRRVDYEPVSLDALEMVVFCPRCAKKQSIQIGQAECTQCALRIHVRVEEPRCPQCEYLLYRLTSDRCPECGALIKQQAASSNLETAP